MNKKSKNNKAKKPIRAAAKKKQPSLKSGKAVKKALVKKNHKPAPKKSGKALKSPVKKIVKKNVIKKAAKVAAGKIKTLKKTVKSALKVVKKSLPKKVAAKKSLSPKPLKKGLPAKALKHKAIVSKLADRKKLTKEKVRTLPLKEAGKNGIKDKMPANKGKITTAIVAVKKEKEKTPSKTLINKTPEKVASKAKPLKPRGKGGRKPKNKNGDDDEPEIIHDELIEQIIQTTRRQPKQPKVPKMLKTFVNPHESLAAALPDPPKKGSLPKKEPKGKFELEYVVRTSAGILYEFLTTPSGLSEWFADDVNIRDGVFTFYWDGSEQKAKLLAFKEEKFLRLQWLDKPDGYYFEFRIEKDELTGDISLMIVDFADEASDMQTSKLLWDSQVGKLLSVLGSN